VLKDNPNDYSVRLSLAEIDFESARYQDAEHNFMEVLAAKPGNARALNGVGLIHLRGSKLAQAEAAFRGSIAADSRYIPAYNNLAVTLERMNRKSQAVSVLQDALRLDPNDENSKRNLERLKAER
jgi:Flp pilus assembly protein TadD